MYIFIIQSKYKRHAYLVSGTAHSDRTVIALLDFSLVPDLALSVIMLALSRYVRALI